MLLKDSFRALLEIIKSELIEIIEISELKRYYKAFNNILDCNIVGYGAYRCTSYEQRQILERGGIITRLANNDEIEEFFKYIVGIAIREILFNSTYFQELKEINSIEF